MKHNSDGNLIRLYGFTQDPNTLDYIIVMRYAENGSLWKNIQNIINDKWIVKLMKLNSIINGLVIIHQQKLAHCDLHHGNILIPYFNHILSISDLGLCKPLEYFQDLSKQNEIYGVLPFVAPEVLIGKPYTAASDIYSFAMIMWEFISGIPPFNDRAHDFHLALNICKGERPRIIENTPLCYTDLMKKCWNEDPLKRPNASEIKYIIEDWIKNIYININVENINEKSRNIIMEFYKADKVLKIKQINISNIHGDSESHPQAYYTSRLLDFIKQLNKTLIEKCIECNQIYSGYEWCQTCNSKRFQLNFNNWTSGNSDIDTFIQRIQLSAKNNNQILEWLPYNKFYDIEYIAEGGFSKVYKAKWKGGYIKSWDVIKHQWKRYCPEFVALKNLNKSQNITLEFINEVIN